MHAQYGIVLRRADKEARRHHDAVILRQRIDMLDAVDPLDDVFEWARHQIYSILRLIPVGRHDNVDHGHGNLRLLLARKGLQRD